MMKRMTKRRLIILLGLMTAGGAGLSASMSMSADEADGFIALTAGEVEFQSIPGVEGVSGAVIKGNPNEAGIYVMRARFAAGFLSKPHRHDQDRHVTVISGTWHFGTDSSGTCDGTTPLPAGSFGFHPKGAIHYDGSCGEPAVVEITGMGPVKTIWVEN